MPWRRRTSRFTRRRESEMRLESDFWRACMKNTPCLSAGNRAEYGKRARSGCVSPDLYVFTVAQIFNLSVSVQIVAGRDDFAERGSVSRSTSIATDALDLSKRW